MNWTADLILDRGRVVVVVLVAKIKPCLFCSGTVAASNILTDPGHPNLREIFVRFYKLIGMSWQRGDLHGCSHTQLAFFCPSEEQTADTQGWSWSEDQGYQFTGITMLAANPGNN